ncbi:TetR/AcrR family transcriptional regulator [Phyllobacterium endophyticum]|uniref:TetR family transcriptional regulator n=1 Tax=Phyllobacterium endophyticum TaxID=1149773 RepID=A0A2P7AZI2_9HYPH|nr:TetR/AcrR family transcriptional regulator [Phyllobacterium endophyticum]MBB3235758.1 AcrR family transcriptional regulator [Phyllobacterium endophyticum]PSH59637.1 TetR family transcriptional regulator [Phyllobacterium endophyticum]TXR48221.1 TetR/AcrR family transcriptional regulator [Phyllobacterium endophyticum]TYR41779.1 TetR/AcrR family transcriptional regulator [Phyllobacterium endophyticum]
MKQETAERPKRINNPQGMRARILDVAADLFQRNGYNATSVHDVVRGAATTGGALHHHFATKKALGLAVIAERVAREVDETAIQPIATAPSAAAGIRTVFNGVADVLERNRAVSGCPLNNLALELSLADADFREAVNAVFDRWRAALSSRLRADRPDLDASRSHDLATLVVASYSGAMAMAKASQSAEPLRACAKQLQTLFAS